MAAVTAATCCTPRLSIEPPPSRSKQHARAAHIRRRMDTNYEYLERAHYYFAVLPISWYLYVYVVKKIGIGLSPAITSSHTLTISCSERASSPRRRGNRSVLVISYPALPTPHAKSSFIFFCLS